MEGFIVDICISVGAIAAVEGFIHLVVISRAVLSFSAEN